MKQPTAKEKYLIARFMTVYRHMSCSVDEVWTSQDAYVALTTWRYCVDAIDELVKGNHGVQPSFIKAYVMQLTTIPSTPRFLDDMAEFITDDQVARAYWDSILKDSHYPHSCPNCGSAAFIGFLQIDCKASCRQ